MNMWKAAQHEKQSDKCKLKLLFQSIKIQNTQRIPRVDNNVEQQEFSHLDSKHVS